MTSVRIQYTSPFFVKECISQRSCVGQATSYDSLGAASASYNDSCKGLKSLQDSLPSVGDLERSKAACGASGGTGGAGSAASGLKRKTLEDDDDDLEEDMSFFSMRGAGKAGVQIQLTEAGKRLVLEGQGGIMKPGGLSTAEAETESLLGFKPHAPGSKDFQDEEEECPELPEKDEEGGARESDGDGDGDAAANKGRGKGGKGKGRKRGSSAGQGTSHEQNKPPKDTKQSKAVTKARSVFEAKKSVLDYTCMWQKKIKTRQFQQAVNQIETAANSLIGVADSESLMAEMIQFVEECKKVNDLFGGMHEDLVLFLESPVEAEDMDRFRRFEAALIADILTSSAQALLRNIEEAPHGLSAREWVACDVGQSVSPV